MALDINLGLSVTATGTVDAITCTASPAPASLTDGLKYFVKTLGTNTSTTPTFAPNLLTAHTIVKNGLSLLAGDIPAVAIIQYDLANTRWELLNPVAQALNVSGASTFMFADIAHAIGGVYKQMPSLSNYTVGALATSSTVVATTETLMGTFATNSGYPNVTVIPLGFFNVHYDTDKAAGSNNYYTFARIYKRVLAGTETLIATTDITTQTAVNTVIQNTTSALITTAITLLSTDLLVIKIYGVMLSASATIDLLYDDNTNARLEMPFAPITGVATKTELQNSADKYAVATGTDTYLATLSPVPTAYATGQSFWIKIPNTNTVSNPTLNINSLGAKTIKGANSVALPIGFFTAGGNYNFVYDGTDFICQAGLMDRKDVSYYRKTGTTTYERWYCSNNGSFVPTTTVLAKDILRAIPFVVSKTITLDRIAMEITGAGTAGSVVRLAIYDDINLVPTNLILDAGTIAGDSATFQSITINQTLTPGLYYLVHNHNSAASITFRAMAASLLPAIWGVPSTLGAGTVGAIVTSTLIYTTMPSTFTTTGIAVSVVTPPIISVRLSA